RSAGQSGALRFSDRWETRQARSWVLPSFLGLGPALAVESVDGRPRPAGGLAGGGRPGEGRGNRLADTVGGCRGWSIRDGRSRSLLADDQPLALKLLVGALHSVGVDHQPQRLRANRGDQISRPIDARRHGAANAISDLLEDWHRAGGLHLHSVLVI